MSDIDHSRKSTITEWRSILTLVVFIISNLIVAFPFNIHFPFPSRLLNLIHDCLGAARIVASRSTSPRHDAGSWTWKRMPLNLTTVPIFAVLLLLASTAIGKRQLFEGTIGANNISPLDILVFSFTLGYISSSIDAAGFIRYICYRALVRYSKAGYRLFFYLYCSMFLLGAFLGNDPVIQMGMLFLTYLSQLSHSIENPVSLLFTQFAAANIASAAMVSSSTTNVIIAQAFKIGFSEYTANSIVPTLTSASFITLFCFGVGNRDLLPKSIVRVEKSIGQQLRPASPNPPSGQAIASLDGLNDGRAVLNTYVDKVSVVVGFALTLATLLTLLSLAAVGLNDIPVFWVSLPASFLMFSWDILSCWTNRHASRNSRDSANGTPYEVDGGDTSACKGLAIDARDPEHAPAAQQNHTAVSSSSSCNNPTRRRTDQEEENRLDQQVSIRTGRNQDIDLGRARALTNKNQQHCDPQANENIRIKYHHRDVGGQDGRASHITDASLKIPRSAASCSTPDEISISFQPSSIGLPHLPQKNSSRPEAQSTLVSRLKEVSLWLHKTFPSVTAVLSHLPYRLLPFIIPAFTLVQALVSTGWLAVFAHWWNGWVTRTGTLGAVAGMGLLSTVLCNFAGTNIGAAILLSRLLQEWANMRATSGTAISERNFWAAVYALALGVNYGAFSMTFGASLGGLGWHEELKKRNFHISQWQFATVNLPILVVSMVLGCTVLLGEVYITRDKTPYEAR